MENHQRGYSRDPQIPEKFEDQEAHCGLERLDPGTLEGKSGNCPICREFLKSPEARCTWCSY